MVLGPSQHTARGAHNAWKQGGHAALLEYRKILQERGAIRGSHDASAAKRKITKQQRSPPAVIEVEPELSVWGAQVSDFQTAGSKGSLLAPALRASKG